MDYLSFIFKPDKLVYKRKTKEKVIHWCHTFLFIQIPAVTNDAKTEYGSGDVLLCLSCWYSKECVVSP